MKISNGSTKAAVGYKVRPNAPLLSPKVFVLLLKLLRNIRYSNVLATFWLSKWPLGSVENYSASHATPESEEETNL